MLIGSYSDKFSLFHSVERRSSSDFRINAAGGGSNGSGDDSGGEDRLGGGKAWLDVDWFVERFKYGFIFFLAD